MKIEFENSFRKLSFLSRLADIKIAWINPIKVACLTPAYTTMQSISLIIHAMKVLICFFFPSNLPVLTMHMWIK